MVCSLVPSMYCLRSDGRWFERKSAPDFCRRTLRRVCTTEAAAAMDEVAARAAAGNGLHERERDELPSCQYEHRTSARVASEKY